jgi:hypothetical protein
MGHSPLGPNHSKFKCLHYHFNVFDLVTVYSAWLASPIANQGTSSHFKLVAFLGALGKCIMWRRWGCLYFLAFWWDLY